MACHNSALDVSLTLQFDRQHRCLLNHGTPCFVFSCVLFCVGCDFLATFGNAFQIVSNKPDPLSPHNIKTKKRKRGTTSATWESIKSRTLFTEMRTDSFSTRLSTLCRHYDDTMSTLCRRRILNSTHPG